MMKEDHKEDIQKKLQQKFMEMQMIDQQIKYFQKQIELIENQVIELETSKQSLSDIGNTKTGSEILVPLNNGIFAKAELKDNKKLLVNVGASTVVTKTVSQVSELISGQIDEIVNAREEIISQLNTLVANANRIRDEIRKLAGEENV